MLKRIAGISFIFLCTAVAWAVLGSTIYYRTSAPAGILRDSVSSTWGIPQDQKPPTASYTEHVERTEKTTEGGKAIERLIRQDVAVGLPLERSDMDVDLRLEHRQKGLLWFSTYTVAFRGIYSFRNTTGRNRSIEFSGPIRHYERKHRKSHRVARISA